MTHTANLLKDGRVLFEGAFVQLDRSTSSGFVGVSVGTYLEPGKQYQLAWPDGTVETIIIQETREASRHPGWEKFLLVTA